MLTLLRDLIGHKAFANASLLRAIRASSLAAEDGELQNALHHIILANRFWLALLVGLPFDQERESRAPETLDGIAARYRETHERESQWISTACQADLDRNMETPFIPGGVFSVAEALLQVCLHSHGHRAQCSARLRSLGGVPPPMDFVLWLPERPAADWT